MYAVERSARRCETLRKIVEGAGAGTIVQVMNRDFLDLDPLEYADVEYIVLDPSCSGSGKLSSRTKNAVYRSELYRYVVRAFQAGLAAVTKSAKILRPTLTDRYC